MEVKLRIEFWNVACNGIGMGRGRIENHLQMEHLREVTA
jgi:hypothetical protein